MNIKKRLLPAALIVILTVACTLLCRETRVLFWTALAVVSAFELENVLHEADLSADKWVWGAYIILHAALCYAGAREVWMVSLFALCAFAVLLRVILQPSLGGRYAVAELFGLVWPFGFYAVVLHAVASERWLPVLALAVLSAWACDSMALIGGKLCGKHKLSPQVSPNKTWEGTLIGAATSVLAGYLIHLILLKAYPLPAVVCMIIALVSSTFGQIGDLAASLIKRMAGVKDYGSLMPEHGGIMDKTDSMLFAIPAAYLLLHIFGMFGMG